MALKDYLTTRGLDLMRDPRVAAFLQDERVMKATMKVIEARGDVQQRIDARVETVARSLNLATKQEVREMKRTIRKMEREMKKLKKP